VERRGAASGGFAGGGGGARAAARTAPLRQPYQSRPAGPPTPQIAQYKPKAFEELAYRETVDKLVRTFGYPPALYDFAFDYNFMMRGLIVDKRRGNIIKVRAAAREGRRACADRLPPLRLTGVDPPRPRPSPPFPTAIPQFTHHQHPPARRTATST
jgi:hypothetical protein